MKQVLAAVCVLIACIVGVGAIFVIKGMFEEPKRVNGGVFFALILQIAIVAGAGWLGVWASKKPPSESASLRAENEKLRKQLEESKRPPADA